MSDPIRPERLLHQARHLAGFEAGRGRPSPTDNRRAVSSAYYAVFHRLGENAAWRGGWRDEDAHRVQRWISHTHLKKVCGWILTIAATDPGAARPSMPDNGVWELLSSPQGGGRTHRVSPDLAAVAEAFLALIEARHDADYDHTKSFPRALARTAVELADDAVRRLDTHWEADDFSVFFALLLASPQSR